MNGPKMGSKRLGALSDQELWIREKNSWHFEEALLCGSGGLCVVVDGQSAKMFIMRAKMIISKHMHIRHSTTAAEETHVMLHVHTIIIITVFIQLVALSSVSLGHNQRGA